MKKSRHSEPRHREGRRGEPRHHRSHRKPSPASAPPQSDSESLSEEVAKKEQQFEGSFGEKFEALHELLDGEGDEDEEEHVDPEEVPDVSLKLSLLEIGRGIICVKIMTPRSKAKTDEKNRISYRDKKCQIFIRIHTIFMDICLVKK